MTDDPKYIAKIQRFYDIMAFKKIDAEDKAVSAVYEERFGMAERIEVYASLLADYDSIFKELLYKEKQ